MGVTEQWVDSEPPTSQQRAGGMPGPWGWREDEKVFSILGFRILGFGVWGDKHVGAG